MTLVQTQQLAKVLQDFDLQANPNAVSAYADVLHFKNDNIKRLFENHPDGRIVLNAKEVCSIESVKNFGLDITSKESDEIFSTIRGLILQNTSFGNSSARALTKGFMDVICSPFLNTQTKKIEDNDGILSSLKGMKIGKALNLILDSNIITESWIDCSKQDIDYIRNNIIGGQIANIIDNAATASNDLSLVLSINPLDFLTMSCGTSWSSCMTPDGEYSSGTLPYATGKDTLIVYLMNTEDEENLNDPKYIVDKIWRQIAYLSEDNLVVMQKSYPDRNDYLSILSSVIIGERANLNLCIDGVKSNINQKIILFNKGLSCGYVDLDYGCTPEFIFGPKEIVSGKQYKISAQEVAYCLQCGTNHHYLSDSFGLCDDCGGNEICENCDCRFNIESEGGITADDWIVCGDCLDHYYVYSDYEGDFIRKSDSTLFAYKDPYNGSLSLDYAYSSGNDIVYKNEIEDFDIEVGSKITNVFYVLEDDLEFCEETGTYFVNIDNMPDDSEEE